MAVRVAQHYTQVVGTPEQSGEIRVRRLYADVLLSNVSTGPQTHNESVNQALSMADAAHGSIPEQAVLHTLSLTQNAVDAQNKPVAASNTLNLVSLGGILQFETPNHVLNINQVVIVFNAIGDRQPVGHTLNLTQSAVSPSAAGSSDTLNLTQNVSIQFPIKESVSNHLGLQHLLSSPIQVSVTDNLGLSDLAGRNLPAQVVTDTLNLVSDSPIGLFAHTLNLTQNVVWGRYFSMSQDIGVTDSVDYTGIFLRSVNHSNIVGHALTWYEDTPCDRKNYAPFQGENTVPEAPASPRDTLQDPQGDTDTFKLYQPSLGVPTSEITLRIPEMDNRDRNAYTRVNNETRGGKLVVYADPNWPEIRTLAVTVIGLTETQVDELQTFMQNTIGQYIGLTDWEGRLWKGVITNPNEPTTQDGREMWTVSFEFEGEMLDVEQPGGEDGTVMSITQQATYQLVNP